MDESRPKAEQPEQTEQADLDRLRAEVAALRAAAPASPSRSGVWRPVLATVLLVLVGLLAPLAIVATWAHDEIQDTDRYVQTVAPLASDPSVQRALADRVTTEVFDRLDVKGVTQQAVAALEARGLPPTATASLQALVGPLVNGIRDFVHTQVLRFFQTNEFQQAWEAANRSAHESMVAVLTGKTNGTVQVQGNTVSINLATIINTVKARLEARGFDLAAKIPTVNAQFTIFESADIQKAQSGFRLLGALARALPILALLLLAAAVLVARNRRRTLVAGALVVAGSMLLLGLVLNAFRAVYLDAVPSDALPQDAAGAIYDQLAHFIRLNLRALLVLFLAIAAIAWVTGPAPAPSAVRRSTNNALDAMRNRSESAGLSTGGFGTALWQYKTPIRAGVLGLALVIYVMAAHPTGRFTIILLVVALLLLLVVELLARRPAEGAAVAATADSAPAPATDDERVLSDRS